MRAKLFFLGLFLGAQIASAQGVITNPRTVLGTVNGITRPIPSATVTVCAALAGGIPCSPALGSVSFKDAALTQPLSNPFTSDANGNYQFAVAPGNYTVTETASGFGGYSYQMSATCSPVGTCTFTGPVTATTLSASGSAALNGGVMTTTLSVSGASALNGGLTTTTATSTGTQRASQQLADQGIACTNGELALSAGWQSTGSATVTAVAGNGQTCSWTITTGTTTAANPTVTDTLTNALPAATTVCELNIHGGTHTAVLGEAFNQTSLSATAPVFTADFTPTAGGTTYFVTRRCGP